MKKFFSIILLLGLINTLNAQNIQEEVNKHLENLPFNQFSITVPTFKDKTYNIKDFGAIGDGLFNNTPIINSTIEKCSEEGGGTVLIPGGLWHTGPITMQSNVNLHLAEGAIVSFSSDLDDYTLVKSGSKYNIPSQINGSKLKNVAITGKGIFNGSGEDWRPVKKEKVNEKEWKRLVKSGGVVTEDGKIWYPRAKALEAAEILSSKKSSEMTPQDYENGKPYMRPYMLNIEKCENVLIEGVTLQNSPKLAMIVRYIDGLVLKDVKALNNWWAQNADGLDISACKNVLLYDCTVNTGDDGICMKSSHEVEGEYRLENIVIKDCKVYHGHGGFVIGSNTDGKMRNIYVNNCSFSWTETGIRIKSGAGRGGRVENIFIDGVSMKDIEDEAIVFELDYEDKGALKKAGHSINEAKIPDFDGFDIKNVYVDGAETAIRIDGFDYCHVKNVSFENITIQSKYGVKASFSENITFKNVNILPTKTPTYELSNVSNVSFDNLNNESTTLQIKGLATQNISVKNSVITKDNFEIEEGIKKKTISIK